MSRDEAGRNYSSGVPEERKVVTILFADIVGSTPLAEEHDADVLCTSALEQSRDRARDQRDRR